MATKNIEEWLIEEIDSATQQPIHQITYDDYNEAHEAYKTMESRTDNEIRIRSIKRKLLLEG